MRVLASALLLTMLASPAMAQWNGWGATLANDRFQRNGKLKPADVPRLQLKWAFGFPGAASAGAQPSIVEDRVYVGSASGIVYCLDLNTGRTYWSFDAGTEVRTAVTTTPNGAAIFSDAAGTVSLRSQSNL